MTTDVTGFVACDCAADRVRPPGGLVQGARRMGCLGSAATCRTSAGRHPSHISRRITDESRCQSGRWPMLAAIATGASP